MGWIKINAKFDSMCIVCNGLVKTGNPIYYSPEENGVRHVKCGPQVGKTFASFCFRLSKLLWNKTVREHFAEIVNYIDRTRYDDAKSDLKYGKYDGYLKRVAYAVLEIKKEYPKVVEQLANASDTMQKIKKIECIFFKHSERLWHFTGQDGTKETTIADNFVLFLPKYSRVVSFESSEKGVEYEQFGWGSLGNVQLQATFGKLLAVAYRKMISLDKPARFADLRFIFRTIRDVRTVHKGMRLDNFSFASTGDADADAFKVANYFVIVGKIASLRPYMDGNYPDHDVPANVKQITIVDSTDRLVCRINFTEARKGNESMDRTIEEFFSTGEVGDRLDKASHIVAIARWNIGDGEPEILYMKNIGEIQPDDEEKNNRMRRFYLLAYMNTRKNVDLESLHCSFPDLTEDELNDEYILIRGENAYFLQYGWNKGSTKWNLDRAEREGSFDWVTEFYTIGPFFKLNPDASKLYLSAKPEGTFSNIYDASEATWPLMVKTGGYVAIGDKPVNVYAYKVKEFLDNLEDKCYTTRILARGAKIPKAYDVANTVCKDPKYKLIDTIGSSGTIVENGQPKEIPSITLVIAKSKPDVNANQIP